MKEDKRGTEEIRAWMEIKKIIFTAGIGAMFTVVLTLFYAALKIVEAATDHPVWRPFGYAVIAVIFGTMVFYLLIHIRDDFIGLAKELDEPEETGG